MNVLLINPQTPDFIQIRDKNFPLSLLYLGASLRASGHQVEIYDSDRKPIAGLADCIDSFQPDLVGITCLFSGKFASVLSICHQVKEHVGLPIIIGGLHPTIFAEDILKNEESIDYVCLGEGEMTMVALADGEPCSDVPGLAYREAGEVKINQRREFIKDLDLLPFPDYELVDLEEYYLYTSNWINPKGLPINVPIPIISSRSCPYRCNFCSMFLVHGDGWRARTAANVVDEIELMHERYHHTYFSFFDDNFTLSKKRAMEIANEIVSRDLDIQFDTPNGLHIGTLDSELLDALVSAGMVRITVAPESGSTYIRNEVIGKKLKDESIYEFFKMVKRYPHLFVQALFIIGFPQETEETLQATFDMVERIADAVHRISLYDLVPFPGTVLFDFCLSNNLLNVQNLDALYRMTEFSNFNGKHTNFIKPFSLSFEDLENFRGRLTEAFPKIKITR